MPPPGAGKKSNRNEQVQETEHQLAGLENQNDQYDSDQPSSSCGQVMSAEVAKKLFDFIEVHILRSSFAGDPVAAWSIRLAKGGATVVGR